MITWNDMARFLAGRMNRQAAAGLLDRQFPGIPIIFDSARFLSLPDLRAATQEIADAGMCWVFRLPGINHAGPRLIRIVEQPLAGRYDVAGTIGLADWSLIVQDKIYEPPWDLAGNMVHEAIHLWQADTNLPFGEGAAYALQQVFISRAGKHDNIYYRNLDAMKTLMLTAN